MSQSPGTAPGTLVLRLSVPVNGCLRPLAVEIAAKVAQYLGDGRPDAAGVGTALDAVAARVAPGDNDEIAGAGDDITFEFRQVEGELLIVARCGTRTSEVRCPLPA